MQSQAVVQGKDDDANTGKVVLISSVAALGGFLFGFDSGVINGTVDALQEAFASDAVGTGFNVASMLLGCAIGAFFAGTLADKFGRRSLMFVAAIVFMVSAWGSGIASSSLEFVVFRVLGGLAVGAASILVPAYISEIAPRRVRGRLATLQQLAIVLGLFIAFLSNYLIARASGGAEEIFWLGFQAWQWMFWMEIIPAGLFLLLLFLIPESPRFLVAAGRLDKAREVLAALSHGRDAQARVADIESTVMTSRKPGLSDIINRATGKVHAIIWIGMGLAILQQLTGINVVFYYGATLWQAAGFSEEDALLVNVISGAVNISFTFVAIALVDKAGRKPLLLAGSLGQAVMLGILAIIFVSASVSENDTLVLTGPMGFYALVAAHLYIAFFAFSWGPVVWVMLGEMFPNQIRGAALALAGLAQWGANFAVTMSFPVLLASVGLGFSYGIYAAFGILAFIMVQRFVRETNGRSLEDMSRELMGKPAYA